MMLVENAAIEIREAEYIGGYKLRLLFSDNKERIVNFEPLPHKKTGHPRRMPR